MRSLLLAVGLVSWAVLPASSIAAPRTVPPRVLLSDHNPSQVRVGVSPLDEAITVIKTDVSGNAGPSLAAVVRGGSGRIDLTQELSRSPGANLPKDVEFSAAGNVFISWGVQPAFSVTRSAERSFRPAGGLFGAPQTWAGDSCGVNSSVRFLATGVPSVACNSTQPSDRSLQRLIVNDADQVEGHTFLDGAVPQLPVSGDSFNPLYDVGPDGTRAVAWTMFEPAPLGAPRTQVLKLAVSPAGTGFRTAETVVSLSSFAFASLSLTDLAVLADGRVAVAWSRSNGTGIPASGSIRVKASGTDGAFGAEIPVSTSGVLGLEVERDGAGAALAWVDSPSGSSNITSSHVASLGSASTLNSIRDLESDVPGMFAIGLRVAPNGSASLGRTALEVDTSRSSFGAWFRPARGRPFEGPLPIGATAPGNTARGFSTAIDRHGSVAAAWVEGSGTSGKVLLGGLDAAGPGLSSLSIPSRLSVGRTGRFSVNAVDPSGIKSVRWDFGDRGSASGSRASHAFRRVGRVRVKVTATDRSGVRSSASRVLVVGR